MYHELNKLMDGMDDSIFEKAEKGFKLKDNVKFHLYINTVTCGDARIFNPNADDELEDFNEDRSNRG